MFEVNPLDICMGYFIGREFAHQSTLAHDSNAITCFLGAKQIVGRHQDRCAFILQRQQEFGKLVTGFGVKTGGRLIE